MKGTTSLWLSNQEHLSEKRRERLASLPVTILQTGRAGPLKETLRDLWHHGSVPAARRFFEGWSGWAIRSRLTP